MSQLDHPNIIKIFNEFYNDKIHIMILEYCPGNSLIHFIQNNGFLNSYEISMFFGQLIQALIYLKSKGIAHSDIKPANILIDRYNRPKLADFGLSKYCDLGVNCSIISGSIPFLAPEIFENKPYDPFIADIWSLGCTIYFCITGSIPWISFKYDRMKDFLQFGNIEFPENIEKDLQLLLFRTLEKNPLRRISLDHIFDLNIFQLSKSLPKPRRLSTFFTSEISKTNRLKINYNYLPTFK